MEERIVIIDGNSLVNRAYYAIQRPMMTKEGLYTQGVYGFLSMLQKIRKDYKPTHMLVAYDRKAPTFRHLEYGEYKAGRRKMPLELAMELPVLKDVLDAMGIKQYEIDGFEADDIIGTTAKMAEDANVPAFIITGDKDALQLATDKTSVIITKKGISEFKLYDDAAMIEEYGFDHKQFIDYKGLRGDTSDNIPGIPGVGEKTATKLLLQFGSIENMIAHVDEIENAKLREKIEDGAQSAMMSKRLATIITNVPVDYTIEDCRIGKEDRDRLIGLYQKLEFKTYLKKLMEEASDPDTSTTIPSTSSGNVSETAEETAASISILQPESLPLTDDVLRSLKDGQEIYIDLETDNDHRKTPSVDLLQICDGKAVYTGLADLALLSGKTLKLCGSGLEKVWYVLKSRGIDTDAMETGSDLALANYVLDPAAKTPALRDLAFSELKVDIAAGTQPNKETQMDLFSAVSADPFEEAKQTAGLKFGAMMALRNLLEQRIDEACLQKVYYDIELPLCKVLAEMEKNGIDVDSGALQEFGKELKVRIDALVQEIYGLAGEEFNINSPMQLGNILFEKMGLPAGKKTKKGYSTNAEILEKLAPDYPIVEKVLEFRTLSKLNSTYVEGLLPLVGADGRIHAHFQQTVTATGRISCTEPNLQNIPVRQELGRQLRKVFTSGSEDMVLMGADYSQIELRVLAHMSNDPTLIEAFNEGLDIHRETAAKVFGVPQDEVTPLMRSNAKAVNFGVIYGMSGFGLSEELSITRKQAEQYIKDYFHRFPGVKQFMDGCIADCKAAGEIRTLYGRRRSVPEIHASQFMVRQLGERLAMNTPIQGTAADIIKLAMIRTEKALREQCPEAQLILQIHDELILRVPKEKEELAGKILRESMENAACLAVKLDVDLNIGQNWYELK
ncbi:MAG: DNA polymerase I [Firmicutes bacterium]|nr:DNA polymerase I [Bacillota bacterium]